MKNTQRIHDERVRIEVIEGLKLACPGETFSLIGASDLVRLWDLIETNTSAASWITLRKYVERDFVRYEAQMREGDQMIQYLDAPTPSVALGLLLVHIIHHRGASASRAHEETP